MTKEESKKDENIFGGIDICLFTDLETINFEELLSKTKTKKDEETKMDVEAHTQPKKLKTIEFIVMVGFHHKVGS